MKWWWQWGPRRKPLRHPGRAAEKEREAKATLTRQSCRKGNALRVKELVQFKLGGEFHRRGHFADDRLLIPRKEFGGD